MNDETMTPPPETVKQSPPMRERPVHDGPRSGARGGKRQAHDKQWEEIYRTAPHSSGLAVSVTRLALREPRYSIAVGRDGEDGKLLPHIGVMRESTLSGVYFKHEYLEIIRELTAEALLHIEKCMKEDHERYLEAQSEREARRPVIERKPYAPSGGRKK